MTAHPASGRSSFGGPQKPKVFPHVHRQQKLPSKPHVERRVIIWRWKFPTAQDLPQRFTRQMRNSFASVGVFLFRVRHARASAPHRLPLPRGWRVVRVRKVINALAQLVRFGLPLPFVALMVLQHAEFPLTAALPPKPEAFAVHCVCAWRPRKANLGKCVM
jgi:hypothetical protein